MGKRPNIILLTLDALRADHLGFMGYQKDITPNLDALAKESVVFTQAFANGPMTPHSFPSILTSTYPLDYHGLQKIERPRVLISEVLKKHGFITAAFHTNVWLSSFFGYNKGWDFFEDMDSANDSNHEGKRKTTSSIQELFKRISLSISPAFYYWARWSAIKYLNMAPREFSLPTKLKINAEFVNRTIKDFVCSIKNEEKPFFLWAHYLDVHSPYFPREYYFKEKSYSAEEVLKKHRFPLHLYPPYDKKKALIRYMSKYLKEGIDFYDYGIEYLDYQIGELIKFLKKENVYDNSIIIVTADHGDEFLEHGSGGHNPKLYNELLHVPLLFRIPNFKPQVIKKKVSLIDLSPTICNFLDIEKPSSFKGKDLFNSSSDFLFHQTALNLNEKNKYTKIENINQCQVACQSEEWKYIFNYKNQEEQLFNLFKDPKEQKNLSVIEPEILLKMRKVIQEFEKVNPPLSLINNS